MGERPVRAWGFWRAGFWRRPVLIWVGAAVAFAVAPIMLSEIPGALAAGRALDQGRLCAEVPEPCLVAVAGRLDGPHGGRWPKNEWWLYRDDGNGLLDFEVAPFSGLDRGAQAVALTLGDERVAAVVTNGETIRARSTGIEGALLNVSMASFGVGMGLGLTLFGRSGWRRTGSVVAVIEIDGPLGESEPARGLWRAALVAVVLVLPAIPLFLGASWWLALVLPVVGFVALRAGFRRRGSGRHAGPGSFAPPA